jgi:hypothetical protein
MAGAFASGLGERGRIMGALRNLTLRTATAVGRLAELQRRAQHTRDQPSPSAVTKAALQALSIALEELQVANEQLQMQIDELDASRTESSCAKHAQDEFANAVPIGPTDPLTRPNHLLFENSRRLA